MSFSITKTQLLFDLYKAFECAKRNKSNKLYIRVFEKDLQNNLSSLCEDLWDRKYIAEPSTCFIVNYPKKREVFAANFRDRIIHHLYFNYVHELYERTFIHDTYSCIKNRGTHFGISRLRKHIIQESNTYKERCYILKMDIKGYFMSIDRMVLLDIVNRSLDKMSSHKISKHSKTKWEDILDFDFIKYLSKTIILLDPTINCNYKSKSEEWHDLPKSKSLFHSNPNCGLPIGNLTSQLFSNVYLNRLDQYVKRVLKMRHYGRYVDDFYIVSKDRRRLHEIIPLIRRFLKEELHLDLHLGKTLITSARQGIEFLGAFIKPYRAYISNQCLRRIKTRVNQYMRNGFGDTNPLNVVNSYLGTFSHYSSYRIRYEYFKTLPRLANYGLFNLAMTKMIC